MLDQVMDHERTAELCKSALGEAAEVYSREAKLTREVGHLRVCLCVVTRQKDDAMSTVLDGICGQHGGWQRVEGLDQRLIGSIRRECVDHVIVYSERHLRHLLLSYMKYYNGIRTHLSLEKDAPISRAVDRAGHIRCRPILGGLHHRYTRI